MVTLFGIPNCDTMKKARKWLADHNIDYEFHDYKKAGIDKATLVKWEKQVGWETLLNRRGMMWRKLTEEQKQTINRNNAIAIMLEIPSIIKRPVLVNGKQMLVGFDETQYQSLFG